MYEGMVGASGLIMWSRNDETRLVEWRMTGGVEAWVWWVERMEEGEET